MNFTTNKLRALVAATLTIVLYFLSLNAYMFWDNVLFASKMGSHLFANGLFSLPIPVEFDPGHPPFLAFINALGWKILGKHNWVSHLVMMPFVFGFLWQLFTFIKFFFHKTDFLLLAFLLVIADPTVSVHLISVNPQIIQLFFFFLAVNGILYKRKAHQIVGLAFLGIVTFRGMMLCAGIFIFEVLWMVSDKRFGIKSFFTKDRLLIYLMGSLPAVLYVAWRLVFVGWLQSHPDSPWSDCWQFVDLQTFLRNILVLVQRYIDFGRIFIVLFVLAYFFVRKKEAVDNTTKLLAILSLASVAVIVIVSLLAVNPMGHRYFIASYICIIILAFYLLAQIKLRKLRVTIYSFLLIGLLSGNLWVYPQHIAQGWDSSLAHLPYFELRKQALEYMDANEMVFQETGTFFPNAVPVDYVDLSDDYRSFNSFDGSNKFVFYSNVYNVSDHDLTIIENQYKPVKEFRKYKLKVIIYERKN